MEPLEGRGIGTEGLPHGALHFVRSARLVRRPFPPVHSPQWPGSRVPRQRVLLQFRDERGLSFDVMLPVVRITPGQADQVLLEMRDSATSSGSEVVTIDVGDRGHAWGSPGYGQGYAIAGDRGWLLDVSISMGDGVEASQRNVVVEVT